MVGMIGVGTILGIIIAVLVAIAIIYVVKVIDTGSLKDTFIYCNFVGCSIQPGVMSTVSRVFGSEC